MKQNLLTGIAFAFLLTACETVKISPDTQLYGKWADIASIYEFRQDDTFSQKLIRRGAISKDTADADSIFGTYRVESKRSNIIFDMKGYRKRLTGQIVTKSYNMPTWNYSVVADTLKYESLGQINSLIKRL